MASLFTEGVHVREGEERRAQGHEVSGELLLLEQGNQNGPIIVDGKLTVIIIIE